MKAWRTEAAGIVSLVFARSRSRARAVTFRSADDAGYPVLFTEMQATRWPEMDRHSPRFKEDRCWDPEFVAAEVARAQD